MFSVFAATFAVLVSAQYVVADCARSYTVVAGDICDSISAAQNVSTYQLAAMNSQIDINCDNLLVGETLCLGDGGSDDCTSTYVVQSGDICDTVASNHGTNTTIFMMNNPQIDATCSNLYVGEVVCVAPSVQVPPAPATPVNTGIPSTAVPAVPTPTPDAGASSSPAPAAAPTPNSVSASVSSFATTFTISSTVSSSTSSSATATASTSVDGGNSDDDSQLPFCDEIDDEE